MKIYWLLFITFFLSNYNSRIKYKINGHIYSKEKELLELIKLGQMAEISLGIIDTMQISKSKEFEYTLKKTKSEKDKKFSVYFGVMVIKKR